MLLSSYDKIMFELKNFNTEELLEEIQWQPLFEEFSEIIKKENNENIAKRLLLDSDNYSELRHVREILNKKWIECSDEVKANLMQELQLSPLETASAYGNLWDFDKSLDLFEEILIDAEKQEDKILQSDTLYNIWEILTRQEKYEEAIPYYEKSLSPATEMDDTERQIKILIGISWSYDGLKRFEEAYKYLDEALTLANKLWNPELQVSVLFNYADTTQEAQNFEKAEIYYKNALKIAKEQDYEQWIIDIEWSLNIMHNSVV